MRSNCSSLRRRLLYVGAGLLMFTILVIAMPTRAMAIGRSEVESRLNAIISRDQNTYWTTTGKACARTSSSHSPSAGTCQSKYYYGHQCKGYAGYVFNEVFGTGYIGPYSSDMSYIPSPNGASEIYRIANGSLDSGDAATVKAAFAGAAPGDFVQMRRRGKSWGHSQIVVSVSDSGVTFLDCNADGYCKVQVYSQSWSTFASKNSGFSIYRANGYDVTTNRAPVGVLDSVTGGVNCVTVRGWAFDPDTPGQSIGVHVYVDGPAGTGRCIGTTTANGSRPDVDNVYHTGANHGFEVTVPCDAGTHEVYVHAIDTSGNGPNIAFGNKTATITTETEKPVISKVEVVSITPDGYRVGCTVTDNVGVTSVKFPTWVVSQGQNGGNAIWKDYTYKHDNYYAFDVKVSDHNDWHGIYATHIYAYDAAGNVASSGIPVGVPVPVKMTNNGDSTYYLFEDSLSWTDAEKRCEGAFGGGHLVTIADASENDIVKSLAVQGSLEQYWIGTSDAEAEGTWEWVDGSSLEGYDSWHANEPDGGTGENCAVMFKKDGEWRDTADASFGSRGYIMEVDGGAFSQQGDVVEIEDGVYSINMFADTSYAVEIAGGATESSANSQLYKANGTDAQRFRFTKNDDGTYTIINVKSGMALDVLGAAQGSNANVQQYTPNGSAAQRWYIERDLTGAYYLRAKCSNCYLNVAGYSFANGANMITWYANGNNQQKFALTPAERVTFANKRIFDVTSEGYKISLDLVRPAGSSKFAQIKEVTCPTWTVNEANQDDITWELATIEGNKLTYEVKTSAHNNETGVNYKTHLYLTDGYGVQYWLTGYMTYVPKSTNAVASWGGSTYYCVDDSSVNWEQAKTAAESQAFNEGHGAHLVSIDSAEEQAVVAQLAKSAAVNNYYFWIGASDGAGTGEWTWLDGTAVAYANWAGDEPILGVENNHACIASGTGVWRDAAYWADQGEMSFGYIVEVEGDDRVGPTLSTPVIYDLDETGFTVDVKLDDPSGVVSAYLEVNASGESDPFHTEPFYSGIVDGGMSTSCRVDVADHGGTAGAYKVTVVATDSLGNVSRTDLADVAGTILVPSSTYVSDYATFYRFDVDATWEEAQAYIASSSIDGLQLASVLSEADDDGIASLIAGAPKAAYWVGLTDAGSDGSWSWSDGAALKYTHWASNQPSSSTGYDYAAVLASNGKWYSYTNDGVSKSSANMGFIGKVTFGQFEPCADGQHEWGEWEVTVEPTADAPGTRSHECARCGAVESEEIPATSLPEGWYPFPDGAKGYVRNGALVKGWMDLGEAKYWFDKETGKMATGWTDLEVDGKTMHYYFNPASGNLARGTWMDIDGEKYYFRPSGNKATGWATISDNGVDKKYYFDPKGQMLTGWWDIDNGQGVTNHYYFRPSGAMATGWAKIDGTQHYFRPSGSMATGFTDVTDDAYKRYFDGDGNMLTGWQEINGSWYYFRSSGAMQTGTATIDGKSYTFSDKGVLTSGTAPAKLSAPARAEAAPDAVDEAVVEPEPEPEPEAKAEPEAEPEAEVEAEAEPEPEPEAEVETEPEPEAEVEAEAEPEPVASGECGTCSWELGADGVLVISPADGSERGTLAEAPVSHGEGDAPGGPADGTDPAETYGWLAPEVAPLVREVRVLEDVRAPRSLAGALAGLEKLESVDLTGLDVSALEDAAGLLDGCDALTRVLVADEAAALSLGVPAELAEVAEI